MSETIPAVDRDVDSKDNKPDYAAETTKRLLREYEHTDNDVSALLDEARPFPKVFEDDETALSAGALVKRMKDLDKRIESYRNLEGEPHLRSLNAINALFFGLRDRLLRRDKKGQAGAIDILQARIDDWQQRKLAKERAERQRIADEEARKAAAAAEEARQKQLREEEARLAAERARNPDRKEEKQAVAETASAAATEATINAEQQQQRAEEAHVATLAKPADLVRTRGDSGVTLTMKTEAYAVIEDETKLDMAALWPFISLDAKEKALRAWAKTTGHTKQMAGAAIGKRQTSVVR